MLGITDEIVLFYNGRMTARKNAHRLPLIVSNAIRLSGLPKDKVKLLIVGNGEMREKLEENLKGTGLMDNTLLYYFMPRDELLKFYWASDIVLVPGILESFSIVGLEASATGRLVVGRERSGISDVILDGKTGLLGHTEEEVSRNLAYALMNPELIEKVGSEARRRVAKKFSWEVIIRKMIKVYKVTLNEADGRDKLYLLYKLSRRIG
nr:glycosyltransferase family 4 protein [Thermococcus stetteri]